MGLKTTGKSGKKHPILKDSESDIEAIRKGLDVSKEEASRIYKRHLTDEVLDAIERNREKAIFKKGTEEGLILNKGGVIKKKKSAPKKMKGGGKIYTMHEKRYAHGGKVSGRKPKYNV